MPTPTIPPTTQCRRNYYLNHILLILGVGLLFIINSSQSATITFPDSRQARYVESLPSYTVSIPRRIHGDGQFISHDVRHAHHTTDAHAPTLRRSTTTHAQTVHYQFNVTNNEEVHVELELNKELLSPGLVIERRNSANVSDVRIERHDGVHCHYLGRVRGQEYSKVALSTCTGLMGYIQSPSGHYFIEPVKGYPPNHVAGQPHVIYPVSHVITTLPNAMPMPENAKMQFEEEAEDVGTKKHHSCATNETSTSEFESSRDEEARRERLRRDTKSQHTRHKRSYSKERYVETLVVVDSLMVDYYKQDDVQMYILTVMNMVAAIYHDVSIGNSINIVLVRLILLEEPEEKLEISHHADKTLDSFCKWQKTVNPKDDKHPNHHDAAVLATRFNICSQKDTPCSTLGMAQVAGMCQAHRSCSVNQDTGLALAYTIAHEIGHNFNMKHDEAKNGCEAPYQIRQHVMSPQLVSDSTPLIWSNCSREAITKFLDRDWGFCLDDEPQAQPFTFPAVPPGVMYDANHQCRLQYGQGAELCEGIEEICSTLWCKVDKKCMTRLEAAVEGTYCDRKDKNKWCIEGQCSLITERDLAVDGMWGAWTGWSECSRTCGAGVSNAVRHCDNPAPSHGGKYCIGERKRFRICNTDSCPEGGVSFRQIQCTEFDTVPYRNKIYTWESVFAPATPCQLHCKPKKQFFSVVLQDMVMDGTPCRIGHRDMCISGKCENIACDWGVNSGAKEDRCGVCHGDGSSCTTVKNQYTEKQGLGYVEATIIPKDARNIRVEEVAEANNYLALRNEKGEYFLNGHWYIQWSGDYDAAGTTVHYERSGNKESFFAPGPLKEPLHIMLLFQSQNPGIVYEYTVPNLNASARRPVFSWQYAEFTHCTLSCGGGIQRRAVLCTEVEAGPVEDQFCEHLSEKPDDVIRVCNTHMCPAKWWSGPWQHCTVSCGNTGVRKRTVICARSVGPDEQIALDDRECKSTEKPRQTKPCKQQSQCPQWMKGEWSQTCTGDPCAVQKRTVTCSSDHATCGHQNRPASYRQCSNVRCGKWMVGQWSMCTQDCGTGVQVRMVRCVHGIQCILSERPASQQFCHQHKCTPRPPTTEAMPTISSELPNRVAKLERGQEVTPVETSRPEPLSFPVTDVPTTRAFKTTTPSNQLSSTADVITERMKEEKAEGDGSKQENSVKDTTGSKTVTTTVTVTTAPVTVTESSSPDMSSTLSSGTTPSSSTTENSATGSNSTADMTAEKLDEMVKSGRGKWKVFYNADGVDESDPDHFRWVTSRWTECDRFCGGGAKRRQVTCLNFQLRMPAPHLACSNLTRPAHTTPCNTQACIPWSASKWSECNVGCGQLGIRRRIVYCTKPNQCDIQDKPIAYMSCFNHCIKWVAGSWSQCSATCGGGEQYRHVMCINQTSYEPAAGCQTTQRPLDEQPCNQHPCRTQNAALLAWTNGCKVDVYPERICHTLKRIGHCKQRYVQAKCCRTCKDRKKHRKGRKQA